MPSVETKLNFVPICGVVRKELRCPSTATDCFANEDWVGLMTAVTQMEAMTSSHEYSRKDFERYKQYLTFVYNRLLESSDICLYPDEYQELIVRIEEALLQE